MKVDIWSDIMCPFCYIGKRKFEGALQQFSNKEDIEVVWHSFQLDPTLEKQSDKDLYDYLAERKGQTREWAKQVNQQVTQSAKQVGLTYNLDNAVVANSFDAHRLIQLAKQKGLGDAAEERVFKAYFTEGKNISDYTTLIQLGSEIGLDASEVEQMLNSSSYAKEVQQDIATAQQLGINGVPFFVLNNKYGVSGAQPSEVFQQALQQAFSEYAKESNLLTINNADADACSIDGNC
jgi:predicted DsbA family dithiol-disulfide isomerase